MSKSSQMLLISNDFDQICDKNKFYSSSTFNKLFTY